MPAFKLNKQELLRCPKISKNLALFLSLAYKIKVMNIIEPILYIGLSQTFFAGILIATKRPATTSNRLIASFMFMLFFDLIFALIKIKILTFYSFPFVAFTYGPILYLYVYFMVHPKKKFNFLNLLHFIPFIIFFIVSVVFRADSVFTDLPGFFVRDRLISLRIVYGITFFSSITCYSVLAFIEIRKHQENLKNTVSYTSGVLTLNWLKIVSISFYAAYFVLFVLGGLNLFINFIPFDPYYTIFVFVTILSFVYSFYAIRQPTLFEDLDGIEEDVASNNNVTGNGQQKYLRSGLKEKDAKKILDDLLDFMDKKKPYLDRDLTIHELARQTGVQKHHITQVLNEYYNRNFFTFINEYRVKEVIRRMKDPANTAFTILAIAYDSGFNSKSTFNTIFKSITGITPSAYISKIDSDSEVQN